MNDLTVRFYLWIKNSINSEWEQYGRSDGYPSKDELLKSNKWAFNNISNLKILKATVNESFG